MKRGTQLSRRGALKLFSAAAAGAALTGCGLSSGSSVPLRVGPGSIKPVPELEGVPFTVGSKDFTEQIVLAYIAEFAMSAAGAEVRDLSNITGSASARNALVSKQIDLLWEYTGSSWISYNGKTDPIPDARAQYDAVRKLDIEANGVTWFALSLKADNTYAFALNQENAARLGVEKLSDLKRVAQQNPQELSFCVESEFASRNDGLPGVAEAYGFQVDQSKVETLSTGPIYSATATGKACNLGEVFTTDGRIQSLDLKVLEDDKQFFPRYNLAMTTRVEMLERYPQLESVFAPISAKLDNQQLLDLNAGVDVDGRDPADVARAWMVEHGFVTAPDAA
ncbi:glycine betaine ABC transporter substrate-binding protein [Saccharopolyspora gloriosae]|uniref:Osmoprotectant transport system substrate-binding protein n=1 Tax=Saccharopolyspora gloriosae TaxID=455344 RepID=A0A840NTB2_9PSEU|nr:glycine betaine ABC transporter substrate-binding protein [Saccharopolyspora gloriosae]MBB5072519.1 osmoprotectant transport system substrate-binding protein [Saccharopolyspora gloriosae]